MKLEYLYGSVAGANAQIQRQEKLLASFKRAFGGTDGVTLISAPGRTEIAGNHTDHNFGCVLAASVDLDTLAAVRPNGTNTVTLYSDMYEAPFTADITADEPDPAEKETTLSLIKGMAAGLRKHGFVTGGFDACVTSTVLRGSGLSSSAAFEVMLGKIFSVLFNNDTLDAGLNARISQWAENNFFMKPCGLMDQMASSVGGMVYIDFAGGNAAVEAIKYDFSARGLGACVVSAGGDHGNLTNEYAAIPAEMKAAARALGGETLSEIGDRIYDSVPLLKGRVPDRAILRALHFADENKRVKRMAACLKSDDLQGFLKGVIESGESSWKLLQNLYVAGSANQEMPLALDMSSRFLAGKGAWRIHGGGFAGTILAFVPLTDMEAYTEYMERVFGRGSVKPLFIRPEGAVKL